MCFSCDHFEVDNVPVNSRKGIVQVNEKWWSRPSHTAQITTVFILILYSTTANASLWITSENGCFVLSFSSFSSQQYKIRALLSHVYQRCKNHPGFITFIEIISTYQFTIEFLGLANWVMKWVFFYIFLHCGIFVFKQKYIQIE